MKFAHTADLHFDGIPQIGRVMPNGLRERENDLVLAMDRIREIVQEEKVECLFISGDVFESHSPSSTARRAWTNWLTSMIDPNMDYLKRIVIISGNHDKPAGDVKSPALGVDGLYLGHAQNLIENWHVPKVNIVERDVVGIIIDGGGGCIVCAPYIEDADQLRAGILNVYRKFEDKVDYFVLVAHLEITGAVTNSSGTKLKTGFSCDDPIFTHPKLRYGALGHLHTPQSWGLPQNGAVLLYPGSPVSKDFNEAKDWRRLFVGDVEAEGVNVFPVDLKDRNFIQLENPGADELAAIPTEAVDGAIIKIRYRGTKHELKGFDIDTGLSCLINKGAFQVRYDTQVVQDEDDSKIDEFSTGHSINELCIRFIDEFAPGDLDKDSLIVAANDILSEEEK